MWVSKASGWTRTPWARANFWGLLIQACTVLSMASMSRDSRTGGRESGVGRGGEGGTVQARGAGPPAILTIPLLEAVLPNGDLVLGLKQRSPNPGLSARLPASPPPWADWILVDPSAPGEPTVRGSGPGGAACPDPLQLMLTGSEVPGGVQAGTGTLPSPTS